MSQPIKEGSFSKGGRNEERPRTERPNTTPPAQGSGIQPNKTLDSFLNLKDSEMTIEEVKTKIAKKKNEIYILEQHLRKLKSKDYIARHNIHKSNVEYNTGMRIYWWFVLCDYVKNLDKDHNKKWINWKGNLYVISEINRGILTGSTPALYEDVPE